jgi:hypothetical protein
MGLFGRRKSSEPLALQYDSLQWDSVMFRDWPEIRQLPYWQQFRRDSRTRGDEGCVYVREHSEVGPLLRHRPDSTTPHVPRPSAYLFTLTSPDGMPLSRSEGDALGSLLTGIVHLPPDAVMIRHMIFRWPIIHVDIVRRAGVQLNEHVTLLRTATPRRHR